MRWSALDVDDDRVEGVRLADGTDDRGRLGRQRRRAPRRRRRRDGRHRPPGAATQAARLPLRGAGRSRRRAAHDRSVRRLPAARGADLPRRILAARWRGRSRHARPRRPSARRFESLRLARAGPSRSGVRPGAPARHLGGPLRGEHARPQRHRRPAPAPRELRLRQRLLRATACSRRRRSAAASPSGSPPATTRRSTSPRSAIERIERNEPIRERNVI